MSYDGIERDKVDRDLVGIPELEFKSLSTDILTRNTFLTRAD